MMIVLLVAHVLTNVLLAQSLRVRSMLSIPTSAQSAVLVQMHVPLAQSHCNPNFKETKNPLLAGKGFFCNLISAVPKLPLFALEPQ